MKKIFGLFILALSISFVACSDDDNDKNVFEIVSSDTSFEAAGGTGTIEVLASETVKATSNRTWLTINSESGKTVTYTVSGTDDLLGRTAEITLKSGGQTHIVAVTQEGIILQINEGTVNFFAKGGQQVYDAGELVKVNSNPVITTDEPWLNAYISNDKLYLEAETNAAAVSRSAKITFNLGLLEKEITVTQNGMAIIPSLSHYSFPRSGGEPLEITFTDDISDDWTAVSSDESWLTLESEGNVLIVNKVEENTTGSHRNAEITVTSKALTYTITMNQGGVPVNQLFLESDEDWFFNRNYATGYVQEDIVGIASQTQSMFNAQFAYLFFENDPSLYGTHYLNVYILQNNSLFAAYYPYVLSAEENTEDRITMEWSGYYAGQSAFLNMTALTYLMEEDLMGEFTVDADDYVNPTKFSLASVEIPENTFTVFAEEMAP